ncbi:hypothetical protein D6D12_01544 [Aureobasidium pullulans]|uniref:Uncharacterized protein n=1 Tax=Aureobasidium pullulans TaxID=5580 RepID=A0AB74K2Y0_AURPU|nr:hypothetical protein D6D12_01544 [Aureobasidium pullulans]
MPSFLELRQQIKAHAHFIYPQYNVDHFAIILVEDITHVPDSRTWKAMLVTLNPDRSSHFLVGAFGECVREAMVVLLITTTHMMRERALGLVTAICSSHKASMSTRTATEISKMLKNPKLADILYKIEATQELLDLQMELFKKHKAAFKRKAKEIEKGLEGGISEVGTVLKQMDKSITIQKAMIDCMEQMAKEGKEQIQRMEERQVLIEALVR